MRKSSITDTRDIKTWLQDDDIMIVDSGFRDSAGVLSNSKPLIGANGGLVVSCVQTLEGLFWHGHPPIDTIMTASCMKVASYKGPISLNSSVLSKLIVSILINILTSMSILNLHTRKCLIDTFRKQTKWLNLRASWRGSRSKSKYELILSKLIILHKIVKK